MKWSQALIPTLKETPADAESISHKLMLRAGCIRKLSSGVYTYLPLGLAVLKNVELILRKHMNAIGAQEVLLPALQPAQLWKDSGRFDALGEDMIKFVDRHGSTMVMGPTHEEVITDLVKNQVNSYKQLPVSLYQIQTKFRDETRPRFGVIRSREFIMKDAYSFDADMEGLDKSYKKFFDAYKKIFKECGLDVVIVEADPGIMGGDISHEFMVLAENGEDIIAYCPACKYTAALNKAECIANRNQPPPERGAAEAAKSVTSNQKEDLKTLQEVNTPNTSSVAGISKLLNQPPSNIVKTIIYLVDNKPIAVLVRGDHDVNEAKLSRFFNTTDIKLADPSTIKKASGADVGFAGPVGIRGSRLMADYALRGMKNFVTGANKNDTHLVNVNLDRDFKVDSWLDARIITGEDPCPKCNKPIAIKNAIEVGHVFKLGTKYSKSLKAKFLDKDGKEKEFIMGCFGIGVNRIVASCIEQNNDKDGIIWPFSLSPYKVLVIALNSQDKKITRLADKLYKEILKIDENILLDDRNMSAGIKLKDADLIGVPIRVIIGPKGISENKVEISLRRNKKIKKVSISKAVKEIKAFLESS